jgi:signal peptidase I
VDGSVARPRRPRRAVLLSLFTPGLGHLYAGEPRRGAIVWAICTVGFLIGMLLATRLAGLGQLLALAAVLVALAVGPAWDAARTARRQSADYRLRGYNRWYVYVGVILISSYAWELIFPSPIASYLGQAYRLPSGSMEPTLLTGDMIMTHPIRGAVERGEIVVYRASGGSYVKRVVGVPGDTLGMRDGQLTVDGKAVRESYAQRDTTDPAVSEFAWQGEYLPDGTTRTDYRASLHNWGPLVVPAGRYFVLGDNRSNSLDSRYVGFIPRDSITARPTIIYFSSDPVTRVIRWTRIGRVIARAGGGR